jgi:hypothetical protein
MVRKRLSVVRAVPKGTGPMQVFETLAACTSMKPSSSSTLFGASESIVLPLATKNEAHLKEERYFHAFPSAGI